MWKEWGMVLYPVPSCKRGAGRESRLGLPAPALPCSALRRDPLTCSHEMEQTGGAQWGRVVEGVQGQEAPGTVCPTHSSSSGPSPFLMSQCPSYPGTY